MGAQNSLIHRVEFDQIIATTGSDAERSGLVAQVGAGMPRHTTDKIVVCCWDGQVSDTSNEWGYVPVNSVRKVHEGMSQIFRLPDQLPVASVLPSAAKRTCDTGRVSPICDPRFVNVFS